MIAAGVDWRVQFRVALYRNISHRTAAPPVYLLAPAIMVLYASLVAVYDVIWLDYWHLMFSIFMKNSS